MHPVRDTSDHLGLLSSSVPLRTVGSFERASEPRESRGSHSHRASKPVERPSQPLKRCQVPPASAADLHAGVSSGGRGFVLIGSPLAFRRASLFRGIGMCSR